MAHFKITLAYDGTDYVGWQRQATGTSIQGLLEDALREFGDGDVAVSGAGRTDAGVHALAQVASFALVRAIAPAAVVRALNAKLPDAVRVMAAEEVPASFHARFDARGKTYRYRIWNGDVLPPFERRYAWHVPGALDVEAMRHAAALIEGQHDFAAFQSAGSDVATTTRNVYASTFVADGALLVYETVADGFLRHMVRALAGSLVEVGRGRHMPDWISRALASRERSAAGRTAPAHGLFLVQVHYADALAAER
ncbi:MAG: tRNA pseudouridine(38-40) synthase TruA [Acidobacteria bacterium]|nr:tRNA pseudouridine(38-40) synthase TruA [Acidobacteriota bacterium]